MAISGAVGLAHEAPVLPIAANPTTCALPSPVAAKQAAEQAGDREQPNVAADFSATGDVVATSAMTSVDGPNTKSAKEATLADGKGSDSNIPGAATDFAAENCAHIGDTAAAMGSFTVAEKCNEHGTSPGIESSPTSGAITDGNILPAATAANENYAEEEARAASDHSASAGSDEMRSGEANAPTTLKDSDNQTEKQEQLGFATQLESSGNSTEQALSESQPNEPTLSIATGCPPTQPYSPQRALSGESQPTDLSSGAAAGGCPETQPYSPTPCTPGMAPMQANKKLPDEFGEEAGKEPETLETVQNSEIVVEEEPLEGGMRDSLPARGGASAGELLPPSTPLKAASESHDSAVATPAASGNPDLPAAAAPTDVAPLVKNAPTADDEVEPQPLPATQERDARVHEEEDNDEMEESTDEMECDNQEEEDIEFGTGTQGGTDVEDEENDPTNAEKTPGADDEEGHSCEFEASPTVARTHSPAATQERMPERVEESFSSASDDESRGDDGDNDNDDIQADNDVNLDDDKKSGKETDGGAGVKESSRRTETLFVKLHSDEDENDDEDGNDAEDPVVELRSSSGGQPRLDPQTIIEGAGPLLTADEETYISQHSPLNRRRHVGRANRGGSLGGSSVGAAATALLRHPYTSPVAKQAKGFGGPVPTSPDQVRSPFPATAPYSVSPAARGQGPLGNSPGSKQQHQGITSSQELVAGLAIRAAAEENFVAEETTAAPSSANSAARAASNEGSGSSGSNNNQNKSRTARSDESATVSSTTGGGPLWLSACNSADASPYCSAADPEKPSSSHASSGETSTSAPVRGAPPTVTAAKAAEGAWISTGRKSGGPKVDADNGRPGENVNHSPLEWSKVHPLPSSRLPAGDASPPGAADQAPANTSALDSALATAEAEDNALNIGSEAADAAQALPSITKQPAAVLPSTTTRGLNTTEWVPRPHKPTTPAALPPPMGGAAAVAESMSDDDEDFVPPCDDGLENTQESALEPDVLRNESAARKRRIKRNSEASSVASTAQRPISNHGSSRSSSNSSNQDSSGSSSITNAKEKQGSKNAGGHDDGQGGFTVAMRRAEDRKRAKVTSLQAHSQVTTTTIAPQPPQLPPPQVPHLVMLTPLAPVAQITSPPGVSTAQSTPAMGSTPAASTASNDAATAASSLHTVLSFLERQWTKGAMDHQQYLQLVTQAVADAQPQGSTAGAPPSSSTNAGNTSHVSEAAANNAPAMAANTAIANTPAAASTAVTLASSVNSTAIPMEEVRNRRLEDTDQTLDEANNDDNGFQGDGGNEWSDDERESNGNDDDDDPFALPRDSDAERAAIAKTSSPFKRKAKATSTRLEASKRSKKNRIRAPFEVAEGDEEDEQEDEAVFDDSLKRVHGQLKASGKPSKSLPLTLHADAHRGVKWAPLWKHLSTQFGWFHMPGDLTQYVFQ